MSQLLFGFVHNLIRLLYSYRDNPVWFTGVTKGLWFVLFSIEYQNDFIIDGFDLLKNDYDVVTYDFIFPTYDNDRKRSISILVFN